VTFQHTRLSVIELHATRGQGSLHAMVRYLDVVAVPLLVLHAGEDGSFSFCQRKMAALWRRVAGER
jgi:hypothetical protein